MGQFKSRLKLVAAGALFSLMGLSLLHRGIFVLHGLRGDNYSPAIIATGAFIALLSLLPMAWIDRLIVRKRSNNLANHGTTHRRHHRPK